MAVALSSEPWSGGRAFAQVAPTATPLPDLILDGRSTTLSGDLRFGRVLLRNRARLEVRAFSGSEDSGKLILRADSIVLESGTSILGDARGFRGQALRDGEGPGHGQGGARSIDGGGGGAYGGDGGDGVLDNVGTSASKGGRSYGASCSHEIERGSAGGAPGVADGDPETARGGHGGAAVALLADSIVVAGTISVHGEDGYVSANDAGGGGAGGGVWIEGRQVDLSGRIIADGGNGGETDDGGGGGGGGRIKVFHSVGAVKRSGLSVDGGQGDGNGANNDGRKGSICIDLTTPTPTAAVSPTPSDTASPTATDTPTDTATPTVGPSDTPNPTETASASATASATATPTPTSTPRPKPLYLPLLLRESCPKAEPDPVSMVLVLDSSSSMSELTTAGRPRLDAAREAAAVAVARLRAPHRLALVSFDGEARLLAPLGSSPDALAAGLAALTPGRGSRIDAGLAMAASLLDGVAAAGPKRVVLLSDGQVNPTTPAEVRAQAEALRARGVLIDAVAWQGPDADLALMAAVAGDAARLHVAPDGEQLVDIFRGLAWEPPPCGGAILWPAAIRREPALGQIERAP